MSIGGADICGAIARQWARSDLDAPFKALWSSDETQADNPALWDSQAVPGAPMPYCVVRIDPSQKVAGMSGPGNTRLEVRAVPVEFHIHTVDIEDDTRSVKQLAADLAAAVIGVFGGHPSQSPVRLELDFGGVLRVQYQSDYGVRLDDITYQWVVSYRMLLDVPVAI